MTTIFQSRSPNSGEIIGEVPDAAPEDIDRCLSRLAKGTEALTLDIQLRAEVLARCAEALGNAHEELIELIVAEVGKTRPEAKNELTYAASFFDTALELLASYPFDKDLGDGRRVRSVPRGTGLLIAPYNDPVAGLTRKIGPCLASGAAALVKPSELGVQCALALGRYFSDAGLDDYIAVLPLTQGEQVQNLIGAPSIGTVSFTGSTRVGLQVAAAAAAHAKAHVGEWGGTNPFVVFADADLDKAVTDLVTRKIKAAGQACSAQNIVYAEAAIAAELSERVAVALGAVRFGPANSDVTMGPVRTPKAVGRLVKVGAHLADRGASLLCGGISAVDETAPCLAAPTAYLVKDPGLLLAEELFGPMMGIASFDDRDALKAQLADNAQPLVAYFYGADLDALEAFASGLRYGSIGFNTTSIQSPEAPTGGFHHAGLGREGGDWGLAEFLTTINIKRSV